MRQGSEATGEFTGRVQAIYVTPSAGEPMQALTEAEAIAGEGLVGDRYLKGTGYYSRRPMPDGGRQITLLETEELNRLEEETGIHLDLAESRRNMPQYFTPLHQSERSDRRAILHRGGSL